MLEVSDALPDVWLQRIRLRQLSAEAAPSLERLWRVGNSAEVERFGGQARLPGFLRSRLSRQALGLVGVERLT